MDLITLAMAKAYTDSKASGGSGGGLPVVELTTAPTSEGAALTAEESAKMDELAAMGMPCIVKYPIGNGNAAGVFTMITGTLDGTEITGFQVDCGNSYSLMRADGPWMFMVQA